METKDFKTVLKIAIPRPLLGYFFYSIPSTVSIERIKVIKPGDWVRVPFGRTHTVGYVIEPPCLFDEKKMGFESSRLKNLIDLGDESASVPEELFKLCQWASEYYHVPLGEVLQVALPNRIAKIKDPNKAAKPKKGRVEDPLLQIISSDQKRIGTSDLSNEQHDAIKKILANSTGTCLLRGITGSGKTEVYIEAAKAILESGKSVLFLVPEISLTPQLFERVRAGLGCEVGVWHSTVSDGERKITWNRLRSGELRVVVGARSGVFSPIQKLGLIIVDEEHDSSYKQEERVRYHARDLAVVRGMQSKARVVLGSATPSLESLERVRDGKYDFAELKSRHEQAELPSIELIDLRTEDLVQTAQTPLAVKTIQALRETLERGEQAMIFLNRRGFASFLLCEDCGHVRECSQCSISMTIHRRPSRLVCHQCGIEDEIPNFCSQCQGIQLKALGFGTESLEDELKEWVPEMKPARLDRDQITSATRLKKVLSDFAKGHTNVLLGTQMLVKGHDFSNVTLVVVVLADALFRWPDFRASEKAYQMLTQVSGRSGRGKLAGRVLIQTFAPEHPVNQVLVGNISVDSFLESEREVRKLLHYPPFGRLVRIRFEHQTAKGAELIAQKTADYICSVEQARNKNLTPLEVLGPSPSAIERLKNQYRYEILLRSQDVAVLQNAVRQARDFAARSKITFLVDVDPISVG